MNEERKEEIIASMYTELNVSFEALAKWFECDNRRIVSAGDDEKLTTAKAGAYTCSHCNGLHIYTHDFKDDSSAYWNMQRQFEVLEKYKIALNKGRVQGRENDRIEIVANPEVDVLFRGAIEFIEELGLTREELLNWYVCGRKTVHASFEEATLASFTRDHVKRGVHAYKCPHGDHFHKGAGGVVKNKQLFSNARNIFIIYRDHGKVPASMLNRN